MQFETSAVLSTSTGRLLGDIGGVYKVISYLVGRDVYTHELVVYGKAVAAALKAAIPTLPLKADAEHVTKDNYHQCLKDWEHQFGETIDLPDSLREVLADDKDCVTTAKEIAPHAEIISVRLPSAD